MSLTTEQEYDKELAICRSLFEKKLIDYGTSWRVLRLPSLTDQLFIKAKRIRSIQDKGTQMIGDDIHGEFIGLVNYSIIALIQMGLGNDDRYELPVEEAMAAYDKHARETKELMLAKNHDYGEAWRDMRISSLADLILTKILRIKQIEDNKGVTLVSEGVDANYRDIINYSIFALILGA
jgi:hypothetical protein